jgi:hypothetical protein
VLDVCRFHAAERAYKGVDLYADAAALLAERTVFVLAGKGDPADIVAMQQARPDRRRQHLRRGDGQLYAAADVYANFSQWEGHNLGIGQALAMGLPVIASDILAHRAFGVTLAEDPVKIARHLPERVSRVTEWDDVLPLFVAEVEDVAVGTLGRTAPPERE